jgi:hypothetical protein
VTKYYFVSNILTIEIGIEKANKVKQKLIVVIAGLVCSQKIMPDQKNFDPALFLLYHNIIRPLSPTI